MRSHLHSFGVDDPGDVDLLLALVGGLINAQQANDPGGDRWARLLDKGVDMFADSLGLPGLQKEIAMTAAAPATQRLQARPRASTLDRSTLMRLAATEYDRFASMLDDAVGRRLEPADRLPGLGRPRHGQPRTRHGGDGSVDAARSQSSAARQEAWRRFHRRAHRSAGGGPNEPVRPTAHRPLATRRPAGSAGTSAHPERGPQPPAARFRSRSAGTTRTGRSAT